MPTKTETVENHAETKSENLYILRYKRGQSVPREVNFKALNDEDAKDKAAKFCSREAVRLIYVKPFLTDLSNHKAL